MNMDNSAIYKRNITNEVFESDILTGYTIDGKLILKIIHQELYPQISIAVAMFVLFLISFILVARWCKKIICIIFGIKAMVLALSALFQALYVILETLFIVQSLLNRDSAMAFSSNHYQLQDLLDILKNSFILMDEIVVLVLFHELYMCTCKMEFRRQKIKPIAIKLLLALVFVCFINSLPVFIRIPLGFTELQTDFFMTNSGVTWWKMALAQPSFWDNVTSLLVTVAILYLGFHIHLSLQKSTQIRSTSRGQHEDNYGYLAALIRLSIVCQLLRLIFRVTKFLWKSHSISNFGECMVDATKELKTFLEGHFECRDTPANIELITSHYCGLIDII